MDSALTTYSSLPAHYVAHKWTSLESFMLYKAANVHSEMEKPKNADWVHIALAFLRAYVEGLGSELLIDDDDKTVYISHLVKGIIQASEELQTGRSTT
jgi:trafficking protein particle complex subunit 10